MALGLCLALLVHFGPTEVLGQQTFGALKANRILFLGNSLTLHGPKPEIQWTGNWGMAASAQDKDYVHLLTAAINARTGGKLIVEPTPVDGHDGAENILNIANILERGYPTLLRWRKEGVDIAQRIVEESHRRKLEVFWEHRLNGADREADVTTPARHPLKDKHPEWLIDGGWWKPGLWNFAVPEVRQYKLTVLREVAERYDLDGLSLDFGRHPPFLPTGQQWEQRDSLTDFVRQVRVMLQEVAKKRGRSFLLSVRVADSVPGCHFDGIDLETWVRQDLVDIIIIGTRSIEVDLAGFRRLTAGSHVKLYPCIDQHHSPDGYHAMSSPDFLRGVAANWWHQGADGIATFNFWNELPAAAKVIGSKGPSIGDQSTHAQLYLEIGDPNVLSPLNKWFVVSRRYGGGFYDRQGNRWNDYLNLNHQTPLPLTLTADPAWVEVYVADNLAA